jgi:predicted O-linked N-acetylglucosamine transferase (SPINDLY family)
MGWSDQQLARRIRDDGIDILVDLAGHTAGNRLLTFARKPAPVQATYLGYVATTGLAAMDYRLTHGDADPPGNDAFYSEKLVRLPNILYCYRPPQADETDVSSTPILTNGYVTFGSMNNFAKVSSETITLWADILRAVPDSRLVISSVSEGASRLSIYALFASHGIEQHRLDLHGRLTFAEFRTLHGEIDIALDSFPFNGGTTTCETLWQGVPVVTLIGKTFVSRVGYMLLKAMALDDLAAADKHQYVDIAVTLARDVERLKSLRSGMRNRFNASPLRDEVTFTRDMEAAFREMWRTYCAAA